MTWNTKLAIALILLVIIRLIFWRRVITFKDKQAQNICLGAWGATVLVECK